MTGSEYGFVEVDRVDAQSDAAVSFLAATMAEIPSVVSWLALMTPILVILCSSTTILSLLASGTRLRARMAGGQQGECGTPRAGCQKCCH